MKWKIPLSIIIDGQEYSLAVESLVEKNQWVIKVKDLSRIKALPEPLTIHFSLEKEMISYEPITRVNRQVAPYIAEDLSKHQRHW